jgi:Flp pilus assembly protein TadG
MDSGDTQAARSDVPRNDLVRRAAPLARARLADDHGAALIEFALLLPFLAVMIFGTVDLGRAFALRNRLTNMAREAAFYGQYHPYNVTQYHATNNPTGCSTSMQRAAQREDPGLTNITLTVTDAATGAAITNACDATATTGLRIRVRVSAPMTVYTPFANVAVGESVVVAAVTEVVVQG